MNIQNTALVLGWIGLACWLVCFLWMHRISSRQHAMLKELHEMTKRIEDLSRVEHDLIRDVHPKVDEIEEEIDDVAADVPPKHPRQSDHDVGIDRIREINSLRWQCGPRSPNDGSRAGGLATIAGHASCKPLANICLRMMDANEVPNSTREPVLSLIISFDRLHSVTVDK